MARLIDADALLAEYDRVHIGEPGKARKLIEEAPRVDAVEVVHGRWINVEQYGNFAVGFCSVCAKEQKEKSANTLRAFHRHCRWCGARMDGDGNA